MTVEIRDKRVGVLAVEKGFVTKDQLFEAFKIQIEEDLEGEKHNLIGLILIELGYLTPAQAEEILAAMRSR